MKPKDPIWNLKKKQKNCSGSLLSHMMSTLNIVLFQAAAFSWPFLLPFSFLHIY
jgi:hypothetical protein